MIPIDFGFQNHMDLIRRCYIAVSIVAQGFVSIDHSFRMSNVFIYLNYHFVPTKRNTKIKMT